MSSDYKIKSSILPVKVIDYSSFLLKPRKVYVISVKV